MSSQPLPLTSLARPKTSPSSTPSSSTGSIRLKSLRRPPSSAWPQKSNSTNGAKALRYGKTTPAQSERSASARPSPPSRSRGVTSQLRDNGAPQRRPGISQTQRLIIPVVWVEEADAAIHLGPIARIVQVVNSALEVERLEDARAALPLRPVLRDVAEVVAMNAQVRI